MVVHLCHLGIVTGVWLLTGPENCRFSWWCPVNPQKQGCPPKNDKLTPPKTRIPMCRHWHHKKGRSLRGHGVAHRLGLDVLGAVGILPERRQITSLKPRQVLRFTASIKFQRQGVVGVLVVDVAWADVSYPHGLRLRACVESTACADTQICLLLVGPCFSGMTQGVGMNLGISLKETTGNGWLYRGIPC